MDKGTKVVSNFLWRFFERFGAQLLNIIVGIILARKLGPGPAGQIAVVLAVINILKVFADSGMANALIQTKARRAWLIFTRPRPVRSRYTIPYTIRPASMAASRAI